MTFADDVLLFARGDVKLMELMMDVLEKLCMYTGMVVNPNKCRIYFGGVDEDTKDKIKLLTNFLEGALPFK